MAQPPVIYAREDDIIGVVRGRARWLWGLFGRGILYNILCGILYRIFFGLAVAQDRYPSLR
jgi:hypothetical protein